MESVLVYGADEFFGLSFCEHLMEEDVNVDVVLAETNDETKQLFLDERLMWLARNEKFRLVEQHDITDYEQVFIQYTGVDLGKIQQPIVLFIYENQLIKEELKECAEQIQTIALPKMYGPWNVTEIDKKSLVDHFFVDDVAAQLANFTRRKKLSSIEFEKITTEQEAFAKIEEWKKQISTIFDNMN
ncbi:hypothetical protein PJ311_05560 [Bacillus sp. CLL-7-23]|uniref:Uncharacterized protein n=1 Tax=Bacillus changyiensis TaxID=3004103 RepID=A0ABT4X1C3_9BACI|nr:hypothetical protein [Bacillus changyiensis]MDA7026081.1 hypothetical protein [Bacillus changyiensis]